MIPVYKLLSLVIRVFARPLINRTKSYHLQRKESKQGKIMESLFIYLGNLYHKFETRLNREFLQLQNAEFFVKPLSDDQAIEKGVEFFYEIVFYFIVIGLPVYELYRANVEAEKKSEVQKQTLSQLQTSLLEIKQENQRFNEQQSELRQLYESVAKSLQLLQLPLLQLDTFKIHAQAQPQIVQPQTVQPSAKTSEIKEQAAQVQNMQNQLDKSFTPQHETTVIVSEPIVEHSSGSSQ